MLEFGLRTWGFAAWTFACAGCGEDDSKRGTARVYEPCELRGGSGVVAKVELLINSLLPAELDANCSGDPSTLSALVTLGAQSCTGLAVNDVGVSGCCQDVATDQNVNAYLVYEIAASGVRLAEQSKYLELPTDSDPVVIVSFKDSPVTDYGSNRVDWCAAD